ncbi:MAG: V-type ATP synthase subunit A, partial [Actinomycetia bacterium]|nr:V-type ATP synthase subunit A [Actinomycetes bacterium]
MREISTRLEEMPAEEGFPAYLPTRLAEFYERAGSVKTLSGEDGSITIVGAISPPGGDFSEPVTQHTKRFVRCFWALDKELAYSRHYPAISWTNSYSEYTPVISNWWKEYDHDWIKLQEKVKYILIREAKLQQIVRLVGPEALPDSERLILFSAELIKSGILQQNAFDKNDMYCTPEKQVFMLRMINIFHNRSDEIIRKGAPLLKIIELDSIENIRRMKSRLKNNDIDKFAQYITELEKELDELEKSY